MFIDTDISRFDVESGSGDNQIVIVRELNYFESLNDVLSNDTDFTKENLGNLMIETNWYYLLIIFKVW